MGRQKFETSEDMQNEDSVRKILENLSPDYNTVVKVNPAMYPFDCAVVQRDGTIKSFLEIKCINYDYGSYPFHLISVGKIVQCIRFAESTGLIFSLVIRWKDKIGIINLDKKRIAGFEIRWFGRNNSRDEYDSEPCIAIPISEFKIVARRNGSNEFEISPNLQAEIESAWLPECA